jgi:flagellar basal body-associated protein FliL
MKVKLTVIISLSLLAVILTAGICIWFLWLSLKDMEPDSISSTYLHDKTAAYMQHVVNIGIEPCLDDDFCYQK